MGYILYALTDYTLESDCEGCSKQSQETTTNKNSMLYFNKALSIAQCTILHIKELRKLHR